MSKKYILTAVAAVILIIAIALFSVNNEATVQSAQKNTKEPVRLLLLGRDRASGLADVIMLVSLDTEGDRAFVMQIPRDTYAYYGIDGHRKLNSAPAYLGEEGMCRFLESSLGIRLDGYISLELDAFCAVIDRIGGVEMELDAPLNYEDPEQGLYIHLPRGKQVLDGKSAEKLVRFRSGYADGDLGRLDAQKKFLAAFCKKIKSSVNIGNAYGLANDILPHLKTNISAPRLVRSGVEALQTELADISFFTLPGQSVISASSGASFYVMSAPSAEEALCQYFGKVEGELDRDKAFLHPTHQNFRLAYEKKAEYSVYSARELS